MENVLVSSCLLAKKVRYNATDVKAKDISFTLIVNKWLADNRVISICPEVDAGMSIPRPSAEIFRGDGMDVWLNETTVYENSGKDVTASFKQGATNALKICIKHNIKVAVLTENSPSCGSRYVYDGSFSGKKIEGVGVTTALLQQNGIIVFNQNDIIKAHHYLLTLESNNINQ